MNSLIRRNGGFPSLFSDWINPELLLLPTFMDLKSSFTPLNRSGLNLPLVNVKEMPKEFVVEMAVPGLAREDFKVEMDNNTLCISSEKEEENNDYTRREFSYNSFSRSFTLPDNVNENDVEARYDNGILKVIIPKRETAFAKTAGAIAVG